MVNYTDLKGKGRTLDHGWDICAWSEVLPIQWDFVLPVNLPSNPRLWPWTLGSDWKNDAKTSKLNEFPAQDVWAHWDSMRSSDWKEFREEMQLLHIERRKLRWFRHLLRIPPGCLPLEVSWAHPPGWSAQSRQRGRITCLTVLYGLINKSAKILILAFCRYICIHIGQPISKKKLQ